MLRQMHAGVKMCQNEHRSRDGISENRGRRRRGTPRQFQTLGMKEGLLFLCCDLSKSYSGVNISKLQKPLTKICEHGSCEASRHA
jgi:hypothetical protein